MATKGARYTIGHGSRVVVARNAGRWIAGGRVVLVAWEADDASQTMPDGTVHPAHRAGFSWEEPEANMARVAS